MLPQKAGYDSKRTPLTHCEQLPRISLDIPQERNCTSNTPKKGSMTGVTIGFIIQFRHS